MDQPSERVTARGKGISRRTKAEPDVPRMTMRVYRVSPETGAVTQELGKVIVMVRDKLAPLQSSQFPPCECPLHRDRNAPGTAEPRPAAHGAPSVGSRARL